MYTGLIRPGQNSAYECITAFHEHTLERHKCFVFLNSRLMLSAFIPYARAVRVI